MVRHNMITGVGAEQVQRSANCVGVYYLNKYIINGGNKLGGRVRVHGAKNAVLPIMAAAVLSGDVCRVYDCPLLSDVRHTVNILNTIGCNATLSGDVLTIDSSNVTGWEIPEDLMREMRSSIIFLGALAGKLGKARLCFPGGCELGNRPIDLHINYTITVQKKQGFSLHLLFFFPVFLLALYLLTGKLGL